MMEDFIIVTMKAGHFYLALPRIGNYILIP